MTTDIQCWPYYCLGCGEVKGRYHRLCAQKIDQDTDGNGGLDVSVSIVPGKVIVEVRHTAIGEK